MGPSIARACFRLCTHSFTVEGVQLLCSVLNDKFGLSTSIHQQRGKPRIYIRTFFGAY
jgi:hypothetical protein